MAYISFQPSDHYNTKLYVGNDTSTNAITGVGFQPDFTWIKNRDATDFHILTDSARGATIYLKSDTNTADTTQANSLKSFDTDGFTVGNIAQINTLPEDYVSWNWKMGTTSGLSGGTITPSDYTFNTTAGQSVIAYPGNGVAGATIPHGLGVTPGLIICKRRNGADNWWVHVKGLTGPQYMILNYDNLVGSATAVWNDTLPTSTVFSVGTDAGINASGGTYIAYCFAPIKGYSKFGEYTGNGDADGTFIYTGFRPAFVMVKNKPSAQAWNTFDDKRSTSTKNVCNKMMQPNDASVEITSAANVKEMDLLSNGFKLHATNDEVNSASQSMLYAAFAEFPFVSSNSIPGTAR